MRNKKELSQIAVYLFAVCIIAIFALPIKARAIVFTEELRSGTYNVSALDSNKNYYVDQVQSVTINLMAQES